MDRQFIIRLLRSVLRITFFVGGIASFLGGYFVALMILFYFRERHKAVGIQHFPDFSFVFLAVVGGGVPSLFIYSLLLKKLERHGPSRNSDRNDSQRR